MSKKYKFSVKLNIILLVLAMCFMGFSPNLASADQTCSASSSQSFVSDGTTSVVGGGSAVPTYSGHYLWTASIPGATWIWSSYKVANSTVDTTVTFQKNVYISDSNVLNAILYFAADNDSAIAVNGTVVSVENTLVPYGQDMVSTFTSQTQKSVNITNYLHSGSNTITFQIKNRGVANSTPESNPAGLMYRLDVSSRNCTEVQPPVSQNPTVNLTANPYSIQAGSSSTLNWSSANANYCTSSFSGSTAISGAVSVYPSSTTTYNITCYGASSTVPATASVTVSVNQVQQQVSGNLYISPNTCSILAGQSTCTVTGATWTTTNANNPVVTDRNTGSVLSNLPSKSSPLTVWVAYPQTIFDLKNGTSVLDTKVAYATCASGTTWNGSVCQTSQFTQNPTVAISASPMSVSYNGASIISWNSSNATSCTGTSGANGWSGSRSTSGSFNTGSLTSTTTYGITCTNSSGSASDSVTISVGNQPAANPTVAISASPMSVSYNGASIISWNSSNATSCTGTSGANGWSGSRSTSGSFNTGSLTSTTTYGITCTNSSGSASDSVTISVGNQENNNNNNNNNGGAGNVNTNTNTNTFNPTNNNIINFPNFPNYPTYPTYPTYPPTVYQPPITYPTYPPTYPPTVVNNQPTVGISADNETIDVNDSTFIRWYTNNATYCNATQGSVGWAGVKDIGPGSFYTGSLSSSRTYTITCSNNYGSATDSVTVTVRRVTNTIIRNNPAPSSLVLVTSSIDRNQPIVPTVDNSKPRPGDEINYNISYQNVGNASISNLTLQIPLPSEVDYISSSPNNPNFFGNTLTFNLGTLRANTDGAVSVRVRVRDNINPGTNLNFPAILSYTNAQGQTQSVNANVSAQVSNANGQDVNNNQNGLGANVFGSGVFLPNTLFGWLLLIILALILMLLVKHVLRTQEQPKYMIAPSDGGHGGDHHGVASH